MKGKINKDGCLIIIRAGINIKQICPIAETAKGAVYCAHWCPLFGEPYHKRGTATGALLKGTSLDICHNKSLFFDELIDERG